MLVKRILAEHGYPPDKRDDAVQTVLQQAELLSDEWAREPSVADLQGRYRELFEKRQRELLSLPEARELRALEERLGRQVLGFPARARARELRAAETREDGHEG
mgnify:CR=1 FL=1